MTEAEHSFLVHLNSIQSEKDFYAWSYRTAVWLTESDRQQELTYHSRRIFQALHSARKILGYTEAQFTLAVDNQGDITIVPVNDVAKNMLERYEQLTIENELSK